MSPAGPALYRSGDSAILIAHRAELPEAAVERDRLLLHTWRERAPCSTTRPGIPGKVLVLEPEPGPIPGPIGVRFGQILPGDQGIDGIDGIEWNGRCGNALAAAAVDLVRRGRSAAPCEFLEGPGGEQRTLAFVRRGVRGGGGVFNVRLEFSRPLGALTGRLFPAAGARHRLATSKGPCDAFLLDAGNPYVLVAARDLGVARVRRAGAVADLDPALEELRGQARVLFGLAQSRVFPKVALVARPPGAAGSTLASAMQTLPAIWHPSYALTGLLTLAVAAGFDGSPAHAAHAAGEGPERLRVLSPTRSFALEIGPSTTVAGHAVPSWIAIEQRVRWEG